MEVDGMGAVVGRVPRVDNADMKFAGSIEVQRSLTRRIVGKLSSCVRAIADTIRDPLVGHLTPIRPGLHNYDWA
jgi:hypothetical protein